MKYRAHVGLVIVGATLFANGVRYVMGFLMADAVTVPGVVSIVLTALSAVLTAVTLSGGGVYIVHALALQPKRKTFSSPAFRVALAMLYVLMLLASVALLAPVLVVTLQKSELVSALPAPWMQWAWAVTAVASLELVAGGATLAYVMHYMPMNERRSQHERAGEVKVIPVVPLSASTRANGNGHHAHECPYCGRTFGTVQARNAHMRFCEKRTEVAHDGH